MWFFACGSCTQTEMESTFGGIMIQYFTWRYIFICVLPVIVLASFIGYFCMSEQIINKHEKFDLLSFIAVAFAFVALIMGFSNLNQVVDHLVFVLCSLSLE